MGIRLVLPAAVFNVPVQPDPLSYLVAPAFGSCQNVNTNITTTTVLQPGTYCGGIAIKNATVTFNPGTYLIAGNFTILGSSTVTANGVTIYMTQTSGYPSGLCHFDTAVIHLTAPVSGAYEGIAVFSDRSLTPGQKMLYISSVNTASTLDGILYLLGQELYTTGEYLSGIHYFGVVADYYSLSSGSFTLSSDYSSLQHGNPFHPTGGGLVQ